MAEKSLNAYATKLAIVFLLCIAIFAPSALARKVAEAEAPDPLVTEDFSLFPCIAFVPQATKCVIDVLKNAIAPHPSCCTAISKLMECSSSSFLKDVPSGDMILIKSVCALWGVSIS